ncbi:DUF3267 domain-containing protein [Spirosoma montaniterrae]|uniref:Zincin peptidase n=1 Tax=Spirosoma montaniterrae TaxID=1178516 RepID=A0A1P9WXW2_9BACT|nr:DUF3267 domain-containing protein [Spirosoma montaniterrae]AQG80215.1 hypothetical protein AWR27_13345 [Spirosoma montaniterrae]
MRPTVDELYQSGRYRLIESFKIDEMNQFIMRELGTKLPEQQPEKHSGKRWLPLFGMGIAGGLIGFLSAYGFFTYVDKPDGPSFLWQLIGVAVGFFVLLPIHEFIHGLAFRRIGAPNVGYGYSLKNLMVYAYSQNFPATTREIAFVAVMPFLVITIALIIGWVLLPVCAVFWAGLLLLHTSACIGDFVLINYHRKNQHRTVYTYDDVDGARMTYFFEEVI